MLKWLLGWLLPCAVWLTGCDTLGYYAQAAGGQLELLRVRRPIPDLLAESGTPAELRNRLELALRVREFASRELGLPDNASYRSYADLHRPVLLWALVATPEFAVEPLTWCYPLVGCAAYRGYFDRAAAEAKAEELRQEGRDLVLNPVTAYSTLGWFDDPLPSTALGRTGPQLAGLILHELAHQQLYLKGDSAFNESFATAVERAGLERWLSQAGDPEQRREWRRRLARDQEFNRQLLATRSRLQALYAEPLDGDVRRARKQEEFAALRRAYQDLKTSWGGYSGFDRWMEAPLNNASLAAVNTYEVWVPAFLALLRRHGGDFPAFYQAAAELSQQPREQRRRRLDSLADQESQMADADWPE